MKKKPQVMSVGGNIHKPRQEGRWFIVICLFVLVVFLGIKITVIAFLNSVPESFFSLSDTQSDRSLNHAPDRFPFAEQASQSGEYHWLSLPNTAPAPSDNPTTPSKVRLGETLFFDKNLSADRSLACESCHRLYEHAGADGASVSTGIRQQKGDKNAPTVWNTAFQKRFFWDGRAASLEEQALKPFLNPIEMGMESSQAIVDRVKEQPKYEALFSAAFTGETDITIEKITQAIASFERTLITNDSPYDDFVRGDRGALSQQQLNGMALFSEVGCTHCHFGPNFSAASVFNPGLPFRIFPANETPLIKKYGFGGLPPKEKVWRVPSLRNVELTGPWLHNGSVKELRDVVKIMSQAQLGRSHSREFIWSGSTLDLLENPDLTDKQVDDIVAFLKSLSSKRLSKAG